MNRPTLSLSGNPGSWSDKARIALVGEAPGPRGNPATPLWPEPKTGAGGRLAAMAGMSRSEWLRSFVRANLLDYYPGPSFPLSVARPLAVPLAQRLSPLPLVLLGRGVQAAFRFPEPDPMVWVDYELEGVWIRAAGLLHPSGLNHYYNCALRKATVGSWLREQAVHPG